MSKSHAKKKREKWIREGKRNPSDNRGTFVLADMHTRKTKTKNEKQFQVKHKGRLSYKEFEDNRSFFIALFLHC